MGNERDKKVKLIFLPVWLDRIFFKHLGINFLLIFNWKMIIKRKNWRKLGMKRFHRKFSNYWRKFACILYIYRIHIFIFILMKNVEKNQKINMFERIFFSHKSDEIKEDPSNGSFIFCSLLIECFMWIFSKFVAWWFWWKRGMILWDLIVWKNLNGWGYFLGWSELCDEKREIYHGK